MMTELLFKGNSTSFFYNNLAAEGGGALQAVTVSSVTLSTTFLSNLLTTVLNMVVQYF